MNKVETPALIHCPACQKQISTAAAFCPNCGHPMSAPKRDAPQKLWHPGIAAVLSLVIPGAGQIYKGQIFIGLLWLLFVTGAYFLLIIPGIILHVFCILHAYSGDPYTK